MSEPPLNQRDINNSDDVINDSIKLRERSVEGGSDVAMTETSGEFISPEPPLGIKKPLLSPKPLGRILLQPKFLYPLGAKSLFGFDTSVISEPSISGEGSLIQLQNDPFLSESSSLMEASVKTSLTPTVNQPFREMSRQTGYDSLSQIDTAPSLGSATITPSHFSTAGLKPPKAITESTFEDLPVTKKNSIISTFVDSPQSSLLQKKTGINFTSHITVVQPSSKTSSSETPVESEASAAVIQAFSEPASIQPTMEGKPATLPTNVQIQTPTPQLKDDLKEASSNTLQPKLTPEASTTSTTTPMPESEVISAEESGINLAPTTPTSASISETPVESEANEAVIQAFSEPASIQLKETEIQLEAMEGKPATLPTNVQIQTPTPQPKDDSKEASSNLIQPLLELDSTWEKEQSWQEALESTSTSIPTEPETQLPLDVSEAENTTRSEFALDSTTPLAIAPTQNPENTIISETSTTIEPSSTVGEPTPSISEFTAEPATVAQRKLTTSDTEVELSPQISETSAPRSDIQTQQQSQGVESPATVRELATSESSLPQPLPEAKQKLDTTVVQLRREDSVEILPTEATNQVSTTPENQQETPVSTDSAITVAQLLSESQESPSLPTVLENLVQLSPLGHSSSIAQPAVKSIHHSSLLTNPSAFNLSSKQPNIIQRMPAATANSTVLDDKTTTSLLLSRSSSINVPTSWSNIAELLGESSTAEAEAPDIQRHSALSTNTPTSWSNLAELLEESTPTEPELPVIQRRLEERKSVNHQPTISQTYPEDEAEEIVFTPEGFRTVSSQTTNITNNRDGLIQTQREGIQQQSVSEVISSVEPTSLEEDYTEEDTQSLEILAREIYNLIRQRLAIEKERRGSYYSGRLPW